MYEQESEGTSAKGYAPDVAKKANLVIWLYFVVSGILLWALIVFVDVYFRVEIEKEAYVKVESVQSEELKELRAFEEEVLAGKKGVLEGKRHVSIDDAMNQLLQVINR